MYFFLVPMLLGFIFNWASAFTHFFSQRLGERGGKLTCFILRNILGIPVWVYGLALASRGSSSLLFIPNLTTKVLGWMLIIMGTILMVWALVLLGLRSFRPTEHDTLVSRGIYDYIRHPIYSGLLLDLIALPLMRPRIPVIVASALGWGYVFIQARLEELDLVERLPAYRRYMQQIPRFFPRLGKRG
jgi:protein-S-isoprenylcysteine O-methyltransferase Ste14